jgi:hypothetical protein
LYLMVNDATSDNVPIAVVLLGVAAADPTRPPSLPQWFHLHLRCDQRLHPQLTPVMLSSAAFLATGTMSGTLAWLIREHRLPASANWLLAAAALAVTATMTALAVTTVRWLTQPTDVIGSATPRSAYRSSTKAWLLPPVLPALLFTGIGATASTLADGPHAALRTGTWAGLTALTCLTLANSRDCAALSFTFATARAAMKGQLPFRLFTFLEQAHHRGVLRRIGPTYQFRHTHLLHHLATATPAPTAQPSDNPARTPHPPRPQHIEGHEHITSPTSDPPHHLNVNPKTAKICNKCRSVDPTRA